MMRIGAVQTGPVFGEKQTNMREIEELIHGQEADLWVMPELALTGYFVGQRYHEVALRLDSDTINQIVYESKGTAVIVGFIEESQSMNFYNAALVAVDGEILFAYRKLNLPNYGLFEERKYFSPGKQVPVFRLHGFTIAVFICNDVWHPSLPYLGVAQKADVFVTLFNSSEDSMGDEFSNIESWNIINTFYSRIFGIYNICANRAGIEAWEDKHSFTVAETTQTSPIDEYTTFPQKQSFHFWGASEIINPFGQQIAKAALHKPDEIMGELSRELIRKKKILLPYLRNDDPYFTHRELERILFKGKEKI